MALGGACQSSGGARHAHHHHHHPGTVQFPPFSIMQVKRRVLLISVDVPGLVLGCARGRLKTLAVEEPGQLGGGGGRRGNHDRATGGRWRYRGSVSPSCFVPWPVRLVGPLLRPD